jgi:uncharacterized RmlC-like cupin family protein
MTRASEVTQARCAVVRVGAAQEGRYALLHAPGISAESVGAERIHLQLVTIPPQGRSKAHRHDNHETACYVLHGQLGVWYGEELREEFVASAGDFVYIAPGVPHVAFNPSDREPAIGVVARTDPHDQESAVLLPELDVLR